MNVSKTGFWQLRYTSAEGQGEIQFSAMEARIIMVSKDKNNLWSSIFVVAEVILSKEIQFLKNYRQGCKMILTSTVISLLWCVKRWRCKWEEQSSVVGIELINRILLMVTDIIKDIKQGKHKGIPHASLNYEREHIKMAANNDTKWCKINKYAY